MGAIISWILGNPLVILAFLGIFTASSIFSEAKTWWNEHRAVQTAVKPWVQAVAQRDNIARAQEQILTEAIEAKQKAEQDAEDLNMEFERESIRRKMVGASECNWTDDDIRLLNDAKAVRTRPAGR